MPTLLAVQVSNHATSILILCSVLLGCFVLLFAGLWYYRRWFLGEDEGESNTGPWTLDDLRRLKEQGEISEEEYRSLREAMIAGFRKKTPSDPANKGSS